MMKASDLLEINKKWKNPISENTLLRKIYILWICTALATSSLYLVIFNSHIILNIQNQLSKGNYIIILAAVIPIAFLSILVFWLSFL